MKRWLTRFGVALVSLATVAAFFIVVIAPQRRDYIWWLVAVVLLAVVWASVPGAKRILAWWSKIRMRVRDYPTLLETVASLEEQLGNARQDQATAEQQVERSFAQGVEEGLMRVRGAQLSEKARLMPTLLSLTITDGGLLLNAELGPRSGVSIGARFAVRIRGSSEVVGVVQVMSLSEGGYAHLACVDARSPEFWRDCEDRASTDREPPSSVELTWYRLLDATHDALGGFVLSQSEVSDDQ